MRNWLIVFVCIPLFSRTALSDDAELTFEQHIRPIFRAHCYDCHGATSDVKGGLDLRLVRFMLNGGESGAAIAPGEPAESYLLDRIVSGEMPPGEHSVPKNEISVIEKWIRGGAKTVRPEPETLAPGLGITPEERSFWSFQPISRPDANVAEFAESDRVRTPIDVLVLKSMPKGVGFAQDADRMTLIKRAFITLIGLPPSPEQIETWSKDSAADWYDRLIDDLLASPHYGERWARHWLDVAGYADSEGYTNTDAERPWAWKYRDWVIQAINNDKPFDQFITEQLAGDELAGPQNGDLTADQIALLTATGFLRMAADGTGSGSDNPIGRNQVITDTLKIVGTSLLGLSIQCAQCHDHRYDPIPQTDYYALRAVFEPALDWKAWKNPNARRVSLYTAADRKAAADLESQTKSISADRATKLAEYMKQALETELKKYAEPLRGQLKDAYQTPAAKRTAEQKKLLAQNPSVNINPGNLYQYIAESKPELAKFDGKIKAIRAKKPVEEFLRALVEPANHVPETKLFFRGDHEQPKQVVSAASLTIAAAEGSRYEIPPNSERFPSTGRRHAFAKWLTNGQHPLVARVIVNRLWMHHFGAGLVSTPADFGKLGVKPTHPELLDWLADEFMSQGWSLKQFHRVVMKSTVWRQSSVADDAQNSSVMFARRRLIRLDAETIRDRMLAASGRLDPKLFGAPIGIKEDDTGQVIVDGGQKRRSLYVKVRRSRPVAMLQAFDAPVMQTNCEVRPASTVATQSLMLMNGQFTLDQASALADRAIKEATPVDVDGLSKLPGVLSALSPQWAYGFGTFDETSNRTASFTKLEHWTGSHWQGGPKLPDPKLGYVLLHQKGGHPHAGRAVIRRWKVRKNGTIAVSGTLHHGSANGDGVRGRVVHNRTGKQGEWTAFNGEAKTPVAAFTVEAGDTVDFITDANGDNYTSDSFNWTVTLECTNSDGTKRSINSADTFAGPLESPETIVGQVSRAWELAFCRKPNTAELQLAVEFVAQQAATLHTSGKILKGKTAVSQAVTNLCQSLFASNEFLYVE